MKHNKEPYEIEQKCYEIHDLIEKGEVEMAKTVLSIELGLAYMEARNEK